MAPALTLASSSTQAVLTLVFGLSATLLGAITSWQAYLFWKVWTEHSDVHHMTGISPSLTALTIKVHAHHSIQNTALVLTLMYRAHQNCKMLPPGIPSLDTGIGSPFQLGPFPPSALTTSLTQDYFATFEDDEDWNCLTRADNRDVTCTRVVSPTA